MVSRVRGLLGNAVDDFMSRLPPAVGSADPSMVAQPYADPGYAMPNVDQNSLNQAPDPALLGYLLAAAQRRANGP